MKDLISRQAAINAILHYTLNPPYYMNEWAKRLIVAIKKDLMDGIEELPTAQSESCEGCKHFGKWENEVEYGYSSPCTQCKRRVGDKYER